ncbi:NAD(P)/FAD-dependent oxidoreductase [Flammeovirgaceae bacterium SG7u.111]|nr:NAD(P)/FAD-dependent oxidoreductase [Flammeovirgaceae bacterium SG7u.132]WPO37494.1 NAD(P)/FAD-dependent oxidoreductase [Flammeovirgaceae bacterium SG7u.111]
MEKYDVCVIGSGMAGLTAASLLTKKGLRVGVLEHNYLPGGCTSSYWRKGFVFETGATTLVGMDEHMPLRHLVNEIGLEIPMKKLQLPMQVHLANGKKINRYENLEEWIAEAERVFGKKNQRAFWEFCYDVSEFVWETSLKQKAFPPENISDLMQAASNADLKQVRYATWALMSMKKLLKRYGLLENKAFVDFVNEQLLITAQNHISEVNVLFGAAALCYTNYGNYYVDGGLINLVKPIVHYLKENESRVHLRNTVEKVTQKDDGYLIHTKKQGDIACDFVISAIPLNNTLPIFENIPKPAFSEKELKPALLNSAFQLGIGYEPHKKLPTLHHQIHLEEPLPEIGSASIFLSISHPEDHTRTDEPGQGVASVSTHISQPNSRSAIDKEKVEAAILNKLEELDFIRKDHIIYTHSSAQKSWEKWTGRAFGFVGGYPQYMKIKPWQMPGNRLDGKGAYICGDSTYPGQGIPGVTLSGIIVADKFMRDQKSYLKRKKYEREMSLL